MTFEIYIFYSNPDNLNSWDAFETNTVEAHRQLDLADTELKSIKKIFDLNSSGDDYQARMKTAANFRNLIENLFNTVSKSNDIIQGKLVR